MSNVLPFPSRTDLAGRVATQAAVDRCAIIEFSPIAANEGRAIDEAVAEGNLESMIKLALHGRSAEARSRASVWLEDIFNVRVV